MRVGVIGLGHMGSAMATRLLDRGDDVVVFNRTKARTASFVDRGAHAAASIADACAVDVVITVLADDAAVEDVVFRAGGVLDSLGEGTVHASMSTISVELSRRLTAAHVSRQRRFVAAPVLGRPEVAAAGELFVVAAGARANVDACMPVFQALAKHTFSVGDDPSAANVIKLADNFLVSTVIEALGEAMTLVGEHGVDRATYLELLTSSIFPAPMFKTYGKFIVEERYEPAALAAPLAFKDIRLALAAGENTRVSMPIASLLRDRFLRLLANGGEKLDWSALGKLAAEDAGKGR